MMDTQKLLMRKHFKPGYIKWIFIVSLLLLCLIPFPIKIEDPFEGYMGETSESQKKIEVILRGYELHSLLLGKWLMPSLYVEEVESGLVYTLECDQFARLHGNTYTVFIHSFYDPLTNTGKGGGVAIVSGDRTSIMIDDLRFGGKVINATEKE